MIPEKEFYEALARTPELPSGLYSRIHRNIGRQKIFARTLVSLAATLVLAIGIVAALGSGSGNLPAEVVSELQTLCDYGSGSDISTDLETYALYDGDLTN